MNNSPDNHVIVTDIRMSFMSMVIFMVKWVIASIPAFIILSIVASIMMTVLEGLMNGMGHH